MTVVYLHGFASSSRSSKATFLAARLAECGAPFVAPDLNQPEFSTLTVTRMLGQVAQAIAAAPGEVALVGSSLGGFVAVHAALAHPAVSRLVLLAPALDFGATRSAHLGEAGLEDWRQRGRLDVFHYGYGRMMSVDYELYADAGRYDAIGARPGMPIQIFMGRRDTSVDPAGVQAWSDARPNVELHMLDDDHQLGASFDYMWREMSRFLFGSSGGAGPVPATIP